MRFLVITRPKLVDRKRRRSSGRATGGARWASREARQMLARLRRRGCDTPMCGLLLSITWSAESLSRSKMGGTSTMRVLLQIAAPAALVLVMMSASTQGQVGGNLAAGPPADVFLEIA